MSDTTTTSGAADLPEALLRSTAADGKTELFNLPGYPLMVRAVDFNRIHIESEMRRAALLDEMQKAALAAGQATAQPAAQQGVAYAALPEPYCNAHDDADACYPDMFSEHQMRAFADATCALRVESLAAAYCEELDKLSQRNYELRLASHGQAPAQPAGPCAICGSDEPFTGTCGSGDPRALCKQPTPTPQSARQRSDLVPGVMHCAKCKFQLNRVTLCVSDGNAYAGDNKTEPCPNGCGPLWPVTWEQEAKNCWKALEEMHERLMAATALAATPTPHAADTGAAAPLLDYAMQIAHERELRVTGFLHDEDGAKRVFEAAIMRHTATGAAQADSVQEDAALWHWLAEYLVGTRTDLDDEIVACETVNDLRKLVEAARKQGATQ